MLSNLTTQAKLAAMGLTLIVVSMISGLLVNPKDLNLWISVVMYVILFPLTVYAINCTVVGKCNTFAWIMGYLYSGLGILIALGIIVVILKN